MAFYFVNDGTVDVAVSFGEDDAQLGFVAWLQSAIAADSADVNGSRSNIVAGTELLQPYSQQEPGLEGVWLDLTPWYNAELPWALLDDTLFADFAGTEASDTAALASSVFWTSSLAATEASDTAALSADVSSSAALSATETTDVASLSAGVSSSADLAATEALDSLAGLAGVSSSAALSVSEATDTASLSATVSNAGAYTLAASTGTYTVTPGVTNLLRGRKFVATTGVYTLQGYASSVSKTLGLTDDTETVVVPWENRSAIIAKNQVELASDENIYVPKENSSAIVPFESRTIVVPAVGPG